MTLQAHPTRPVALHFGAGNIGRGFIGALLSQAGYHVIFADINEQLIGALQRQGHYQVHIQDVNARSEDISGVGAVLSNGPEIIPAIVDAALITTAVGPNVLKVIAKTLAQGLEARAAADKGDLNIIACENMVGASSFLREQVQSCLSPAANAYVAKHVGFPNASVDRIVPPFSGEQLLDVGVEAFFEWIVERPAFKGPVPNIPGMTLTDNLVAYVQRKLFTLNTGHAVAAYLGNVRGYTTIDQSVADPEIRAAVLAAMRESGAALSRKYGFDPAEHEAYILKIERRFNNPHLRDEVLRVGREPLRKLGPTDRLLGPVNMTREFGLPRAALLRGAAAALHYRNPADPQAAELQRLISEQGLSAAASQITGLESASPEHTELLKAYQQLADAKLPT